MNTGYGNQLGLTRIRSIDCLILLRGSGIAGGRGRVNVGPQMYFVFCRLYPSSPPATTVVFGSYLLYY